VLQRLLADPWFLFPVDTLGAMRSTEHARVLDERKVDAMLRRTRMGYHRAVAALASVAIYALLAIFGHAEAFGEWWWLAALWAGSRAGSLVSRPKASARQPSGMPMGATTGSDR